MSQAVIYRRIGRRIQTIRRLLGYRKSKFAKELGMSRENLKSIENGETPIRVDTLIEVSTISGKSIEFIATGRGNGQVPESRAS